MNLDERKKLKENKKETKENETKNRDFHFTSQMVFGYKTMQLNKSVSWFRV